MAADRSPEEATFAELTADMLSPRVVSEELTCAYRALDNLAHQKNIRPHDNNETISLCYETHEGDVQFLRIRLDAPNVVRVIFESGAGRHRAPESIVGYMDTYGMTAKIAGNSLLAANAIVAGQEMLDMGQANVMVKPYLLG